jgi:hypothetical protein
LALAGKGLAEAIPLSPLLPLAKIGNPSLSLALAHSLSLSLQRRFEWRAATMACLDVMLSHLRVTNAFMSNTIYFINIACNRKGDGT